MTVDYKISKALNSDKLPVITIYNFISVYSSFIVCALIIVFYDTTPSKQYIKALIILFLIIFIAKRFTKRKRPYVKHNDIYNRDIISNKPTNSFPSMHTMSSTLASYMIYRLYKVPYVFPVWPILSIISRVGLGAHYISDCIITFALTLGINFIFYL